jgi:hypothetical protein
MGASAGGSGTGRRLSEAASLELTYSIVPEASLVEEEPEVVDLASDDAIVDELPIVTDDGDTSETTDGETTDGEDSSGTTTTSDVTAFSAASTASKDMSVFLASLSALEAKVKASATDGSLLTLEFDGTSVSVEQDSLAFSLEAPTAAICLFECKVRCLCPQQEHAVLQLTMQESLHRCTLMFTASAPAYLCNRIPQVCPDVCMATQSMSC